MAVRRGVRVPACARAATVGFLILFALPSTGAADSHRGAHATIATDFLLHDGNGKSLFDRPRWRSRRAAGTSGPEDDRLQMSFSVGDERFSYALCHAADTFAAEAFVTDGNGARRMIDSRPTTYTTCTPSSASATVTFIDSHTITGVAQKGGALFDLLTVAAPSAGAEAAPRLSVAKEANPMSAATPCMAGHDHDHGEAAHGSDPGGGANTTGKLPLSAPTPPGRERRSAYVGVDPGSVAKWSECYPGDSKLHQMEIGIAVGSKVRALFDSESQCLAYITSVVTAANYYVFERQLNMRFLVKDVQIADGTTTFKWDIKDGATCQQDISHQLDWLKTWTASNEDVAAWHLIDACYGVSGTTAGIASLGTICRSEENSYNTLFLNGG